MVGGYGLSGTYTAESPQYVTPQSAVDANLNGDPVSDRTVINPNGLSERAAISPPLNNSAGQTVAYVAVNPTAQYLLAKPGVYANAGRNTLRTQGINNFDISVAKTFSVRERSRVGIRADFYNALNHCAIHPGADQQYQLDSARKWGVLPDSRQPVFRALGPRLPEQRSQHPVSPEIQLLTCNSFLESMRGHSGPRIFHILKHASVCCPRPMPVFSLLGCSKSEPVADKIVKSDPRANRQSPLKKIRPHWRGRRLDPESKIATINIRRSAIGWER